MDEVSSLDQQTLGVYRAILFHKEHDPVQLAKLLDSTPEEVEAALGRLSKLSLLAPSRDSPGRLRAVNPALGLKVLLQREQDELAWRQQQIEQNRSALAALAAEYTASGGPSRSAAPNTSTTSTTSASASKPWPSPVPWSPSPSTPSTH